jgi:hypothetical protein
MKQTPWNAEEEEEEVGKNQQQQSKLEQHTRKSAV